MKLKSTNSLNLKTKILTLVAILALAVQPVYGIIENQIAKAAPNELLALTFDEESTTTTNVNELSGPIRINLNSPAGDNVKLIISSSSSTGKFALTSGGKLSESNIKEATFTVGTRTKAFYYKDSTAGSVTITAELQDNNTSAPLSSPQQHQITVADNTPKPLNPQVTMQGGNFNTHNGDDYKGINVGFSLNEDFRNITELSVSLKKDDATLVTNTHNDTLISHINSGNKLLSTPFIIQNKGYQETHWSLGTRTWSKDDKPTGFVVTVTDDSGVNFWPFTPVLSESTSTFESLFPETNPDTKNYQYTVRGTLYRDISLNNCNGPAQCKEQKSGDVLEGWTVRLYKEDPENSPDWNEIKTAVTDSKGLFNFGGVRGAGTYHVCVALKDGWTQPIQTWGGGGYLVDTPNKSKNTDEGPYCTTSSFANTKNHSTAVNIGMVDTTDPEIAADKPASVISLSKNDYTTSGLASDNESGLDRVVLYVTDKNNSGEAAFRKVTREFGENGKWEIKVPAGQLPDGTYGFNFTVYDKANNSKVERHEVIVDNVAPKATIKPSPSSVTHEGGIYSKISFKLEDNRQVNSYAVNEKHHKLTPNKWSDANNITVGGWQGARYGKNTFTVYDVAGNSSSYDFYLDNKKPEVAISEARQVNKDKLEFSGTISDENFRHYYCYLTKSTGGEIKNTRDDNCLTTWAKDLKRNGNPATQLTTGTDGVEKIGGFDLTGLESGQYVINLVAVDRAKNQSEIAKYTINVDRTAPTAELSYHQDSSSPNSSVLVTIELDKDIESISEGWARDEANQRKFTKVFTENGEFVVEFTDNLGNTGFVTGEVGGIRHEAPQTDPIGGDPQAGQPSGPSESSGEERPNSSFGGQATALPGTASGTVAVSSQSLTQASQTNPNASEAGTSDEPTVAGASDEDRNNNNNRANSVISEDRDVLSSQDSQSGWSLINLIGTILVVLMSILALPGLVRNKENRRPVVRLLTLVPSAGAIALILSVENFSSSIHLVNTWSVVMAAIVVLQIIIVSQINKNSPSEPAPSQ